MTPVLQQQMELEHAKLRCGLAQNLIDIFEQLTDPRSTSVVTDAIALAEVQVGAMNFINGLARYVVANQVLTVIDQLQDAGEPVTMGDIGGVLMQKNQEANALLNDSRYPFGLLGAGYLVAYNAASDKMINMLADMENVLAADAPVDAVQAPMDIAAVEKMFGLAPGSVRETAPGVFEGRSNEETDGLDGGPSHLPPLQFPDHPAMPQRSDAFFATSHGARSPRAG